MQVLLIQLNDGPLVVAEETGILELIDSSVTLVTEVRPAIPNLCDLMPGFSISCSSIVEERVSQLFQAQKIRFSRPRNRKSIVGLVTVLRAIFQQQANWRILNLG